MKTKYVVGAAIGLAAFWFLRGRASAAPAGVGADNAERDNDRIVDYIPTQGTASASLGASVKSGGGGKGASSPSVLTQVQRGTGSAATFVTDAARAGAKVLGGLFSEPVKPTDSQRGVQSPPIVDRDVSGRTRNGFNFI
jgi:hypothetical protein